MRERILKMPIRCYRLDRLYGPGMDSYVKEGLAEEIIEKPVSQVGLVAVHCWNLGEPDGPYPIGPDAHCPGSVADWVPTAHDIIRDHIRPAFDAAREAGITIFHMGGPGYAPKYPTYAKIAADPELTPPKREGKPEPGGEPMRCVRPVDAHDRIFGENFPGSPWAKTHPGIHDIAKALRPTDTEPMLTTGRQLNGLCRRMDIDTLFYVGFMADVCLIAIPGAVRYMNGRGYRCVVLRECTTAYEYPDTYEGRWMLRTLLRKVEAGMGYTASTSDFIEGAQRAAGENA